MKRLALLVLAAAAALLALAIPAAAHVTVSSPGATRGGGDQEITFRVPVEKDVATTGLTVVLPTATPIASVDVAHMDGWSHTQKSTKLAKPIHTDDGDITTAVSQVTWTADKGAALQPGEYGTFTLLAGQLPDAPSLTFRAVQTYSDGSVVRWIEQAAPGSTAEPEHPAPTLKLAAADPATTAAPAAAKPAAAPSNTGPVVLSIVALVLAAAALGLAVVSRVRRANS